MRSLERSARRREKLLLALRRESEDRDRALATALAQQTATAEILRVISSTPADTQPVFEAIVNSTQRLMAGKSTVLLLRRDPQFVVGAYAGPAIANLPDQVRAAPLDREQNFPSRAILDAEVVHVPDWGADDVPEHERVVGRSFGIRAGLIVPLLREGQGIGALVDSQGAKGNRNDVEGRTIFGVHDVFRPDGGQHRVFQTLYWRSFRYIQLDVETGETALTIQDVHGIFTGYPLRERAAFASDQSWLADVWRMDWNGARIGAFETYMDTPYYEQLQYVGDTRVQSLISLYMSGDDRLVRQAIEAFDESRIPDGLTMSRYPSALPQVIPPFSLIYVAMVDDYHMLRDDPSFVRQRLAGIRGVLEWYASYIDSTGMLGPMPYWNYVDWAREWQNGVPAGALDGHSTTITLLYAYALQRAADVEAGVGVPAMAASYRARADHAIAATRGRAWDPARRLFRDAPGVASYSQQTNVVAVLCGAVPAGEQRALMERVLADSSLTQATYYFKFYLFEAMRAAGLGDRVIEQLEPWRGMLSLGLTSTPENPEPTRSDSHAWAAHPNYTLLATVLGVRPSSAGFRTVRIAPALGPLQRAEGRVPHPAGDIELRLTRRGPGGIEAVVTLPAGLSGEFSWAGRRIPLHAGRQELTVNPR